MLIVIIMLISLPVLNVLNIAIGEPLKGEWTPAGKKILSKKSWFDVTYQDSLTRYLNDLQSYRPLLVRISNQYNYTVFSSLDSRYFLIGKDGWFWEKEYLNSFNGKDFSGPSKLIEMFNDLVFIQKELEKRNIGFVFVITPGKPQLFPDEIPSREIAKKPNPTNYSFLRSLLDTGFRQLHVIDFARWFMAEKERLKYPVYTKAGTHWTTITAQYTVCDSLLKYYATITRRNIPRISLDSIIMKEVWNDPDDDLVKMSNLLFQPSFGTLPYPCLSLRMNNNASKLSVLASADSYYWQIFNSPCWQQAMANNDFWYYNKIPYPKEKYGTRTYHDTAWMRHDLLNHDLVMLLSTETNLGYLFDFTKATRIMLDPANSIRFDSLYEKDSIIEYYRKGMLINTDWLQDLKLQARLQNRQLDEVMNENAEWMYREQLKKKLKSEINKR